MEKEREKELREKAQKAMEDFGWYIHCVQDNDGNYVEYHTHGLLATFGHIDLQIVSVPDLSYMKAYDILTSIISSIINKEKFTNNDTLTIEEEYTLYKMKMVMEKEFPRPLLRIIIPDENNLYPWDNGVNPYYKSQFDGEDVEINNYMMYGYFK